MPITLTTGNLVQINGVTVENDTVGIVTSMDLDFIAGTVTFVLRIGSLVGNTFTAGSFSQFVALTINLATGSWFTNNGLSGNVSGAGLSSFISQMAGIRNTVETFAAGPSGIMPGTQVAWAPTSI